MAAGKLTAIENGLIERLKALTFSPAIPIAYENVPFTPPVGGIYLEPTFLPNRPERAGIGANAWRRQRGLYQILVHAALDVGVSAGSTVADAIIEHFADQIIAASGVRIRIGSYDGGPDLPWRTAAFRQPTGRVIPVTIPWWADIDPALVPAVA